jgi:hypoxanthine phosphoribosyltransferase
LSGYRVTPLISKDLLRSQVYELGKAIGEHYTGRRLTAVMVLNGAVLFTAGLMPRFEDVPMVLEAVKARSYEDSLRGPLRVDMSMLDRAQITDRDVLIIDDILDTGQTLYRVWERLQALSPKSLRAAVLLRKLGRQQPQFAIEPDYCGFEIDTGYVVGYGLDYRGLFRNLAWIGVLQDV